MPQAVQMIVILSCFLPIALGRNHRFDALLVTTRQNFVRVIGSVRQQGPGIHTFNQDASLATIC